MNIGALGKDNGKQDKGKHGKGKGRGQQGRHGQHDKNKDKNKDSTECWNCGKRGPYWKDCWSKKDQTNKGGSKDKKKQERNGRPPSRFKEASKHKTRS